MRKKGRNQIQYKYTKFEKGTIERGAIFIVIIIMTLVFAAYIFVGGTLPTKMPGTNNNLVVLIPPSKQPARSNLQLYTFSGATVTPFPSIPQNQIAASGMPYVLGAEIEDQNGNPLHLHGVQIPSEFNLGWKGGGTLNTVVGPQVVAAIASWKANALRLPVGAYEYQLPGYMTALDAIVQDANQKGLYVILANFEDSQAMGGSGVLDQKGLQFWQYIAQHYANNPMIMYDIINEPHNASWQEWLNGNGSVVGMQQAVDAIRKAGAKQIIVAETIDNNTQGFNGFTSFIHDPNIMYSRHVYFKTAADRTTAGWDSSFGNLSQQYPILIGEWAVLPNARYPSFCNGLDAASGTLLVQQFISYMDQHNINWTAWAFNANHLITDTTTFTPTTMNASWCCGQGPVCSAGMGSLIQQNL